MCQLTKLRQAIAVCGACIGKYEGFEHRLLWENHFYIFQFYSYIFINIFKVKVCKVLFEIGLVLFGNKHLFYR